jgi:hypothetical protein
MKNKKITETASHILRTLWQEGLFREWKSQEDVAIYLFKRGQNFKTDTLRKALARADHLTNKKEGGTTKYIQTNHAVSKAADNIENELFEDSLLKKFGKSFEIEMTDLRHNFGVSGNCTAFLLRKILEKLIFITFAQHGVQAKLEDPGATGTGRLIGLEAMINAAAKEKIKGISLLTTHTAQEIRGIKFLGDISAHNPLTEVDMKTIIPQMPFIITAYKELLR